MLFAWADTAPATAGCLLAPEIYDRHVWRRVGGLALGIGVCLWWTPGVPDYVGLSGVLYGIFALVLLPQAWRGDRHAGLALAGTAGWMLWQWGVGPSGVEERLIGGRIIGIAHVYGFLLGMAAQVAGAGPRHWLSRRKPSIPAAGHLPD